MFEGEDASLTKTAIAQLRPANKKPVPAFLKAEKNRPLRVRKALERKRVKTAMSPSQLPGAGRLPERTMQALESIHDMIKPLEDKPDKINMRQTSVKRRLQFTKNINL